MRQERRTTSSDTPDSSTAEAELEPLEPPPGSEAEPEAELEPLEPPPEPEAESEAELEPLESPPEPEAELGTSPEPEAGFAGMSFGLRCWGFGFRLHNRDGLIPSASSQVTVTPSCDL